jgi:single-strand DNA-binding protein
MADLNKVFLMGRLTFDPELRRTPGGTAVTELRLATTRSWSGRDGERREDTLFIGVTVWDRQAENCCQFLRKGSSVHVEGSLKMDTWDDKNTGEKRSKILVNADRVQFLDSRRGDSGGAMSGNSEDDFAGAPQTAREPAARRGGAAPARGDGGASEPRGSTNGPGRPAYPPTTAADNSPSNEPVEAEEDDIPF